VLERQNSRPMDPAVAVEGHLLKHGPDRAAAAPPPLARLATAPLRLLLVGSNFAEVRHSLQGGHGMGLGFPVDLCKQTKTACRVRQSHLEESLF